MISSNNLFHFTDSKIKLKKILENGFQPHYSLEKLGIKIENEFLNALSEQFGFQDSKFDFNDEFAIPMSCFCDIPLNLVDNHRNIYGNYAIGLKKSWGERQAISPIIYLPEQGETRNLFEKLIKTHQKYINASIDVERPKNPFLFEIDKLFDIIVDLTMFVKPYCGFFQKGSYQNDNYKFYDEREWRYKPDKYLCKSYLTKEEFKSFVTRKEPYKNMGFIKFDSKDISDIIVPKDEVKEFRKLILKIPRFDKIDTKIIDTIENRR